MGGTWRCHMPRLYTLSAAPLWICKQICAEIDMNYKCECLWVQKNAVGSFPQSSEGFARTSWGPESSTEQNKLLSKTWMNEWIQCVKSRNMHVCCKASAVRVWCPFLLGEPLMQEQLQEWAWVWSCWLIGRKLFTAEVTRGPLGKGGAKGSLSLTAWK